MQQILEAEMADHLSYDKHSADGNNTGNSRNGYSKKTIRTKYGPTDINIPRDRNAEFEPQIIKKRQLLAGCLQ
jgi:putative transposase